MLFRNKELDRAFEFIANSDFDIFCLQEVPEKFLARLKTLPFHIASRTDVEKLYGEEIVPMFNVILSKHPITTRGEIPFPEYWHLLPLRTRIFVHLMPNRFFTKIRNRGGLYADITISEIYVRVFNLHIVLAQPAWRLKEFDMAMAECDPSRPTIVCGDFNTIESPHISILNWILGGSVSDAFLPRCERMHIEKRFVEHELINPLRGKNTHAFSRNQFDHILVSHTFTIKNASVLPNRIGSDHHPIFVEVV
ncbi:endonuclease/exonuclease/phosphatase family protein [Candidatus Kaiserbacteria bacterium]|nr:endonuclease/exonuclease/phosphatase family protein [Candidatus Kaiserbacteria bacterium]